MTDIDTYLDALGSWEVTEHARDMILVCRMDDKGQHAHCVAEFFMVGREARDWDWDEERGCLTDEGFRYVMGFAHAASKAPAMLRILARLMERADSPPPGITMTYDPLAEQARAILAELMEKEWEPWTPPARGWLHRLWERIT